MKTVRIKAMSCNHCVMAIKKALEKIPGIKNAEVDLKKGEASFEETTPVDMGVVAAMIKKAGYEIG